MGVEVRLLDFLSGEHVAADEPKDSGESFSREYDEVMTPRRRLII